MTDGREGGRTNEEGRRIKKKRERGGSKEDQHYDGYVEMLMWW
jgi:hypothetical protein